MRKPLNVTAFVKSIELTSGLTFRWTRSPLIVGVKLRRMPNSLYETVTVTPVPFGETLEQSARLQSLDGRPKVVLEVPQEEVQVVREGQLVAGCATGVECRRCVLLSRRTADHV